jgi:hypothetical protein
MVIHDTFDAIAPMAGSMNLTMILPSIETWPTTCMTDSKAPVAGVVA